MNVNIPVRRLMSVTGDVIMHASSLTQSKILKSNAGGRELFHAAAAYCRDAVAAIISHHSSRLGLHLYIQTP